MPSDGSLVDAVGDARLELTEGLDGQQRGGLLPGLDDVDGHLVIETERSVAHAVGPGAVHLGVPDMGARPEARYEAKETIVGALVLTVQRLPPRQRAALVLGDVPGFRSAEVAEMLSLVRRR